MPNLPLNINIRLLGLWSVVLLSGADNRLISVFTHLNTKVYRCLLNEYKRLIEDVVIGNQGVVKILRVAAIRELRK